MSSVGAILCGLDTCCGRWSAHMRLLLRKWWAWVPHGGMDSCCGWWSPHMSSMGATRWPWTPVAEGVVGTHEQHGCHTVAWTVVAEGGRSTHMSSMGATRWHGLLLRKVVGTHEERGCHTVA